MTTVPYYRKLDVYLHQGRVGVMAEYACESGSASETSEFREMMHDVTLHIAAEAPETMEQLMEQTFIKDESKQVKDVVNEVSRRLKEKIVVSRFMRWTTEHKPYEVGSEPPRSPAVIQKVS
jgi:elongation factor Ts